MRMSEGRGLPAGTLTFLFTDIEGSTKLQNELGTARYQDVLETHTRILRDAIKDGGVEVRVDGDALFVVFPVAVDAVRAAAAAQRALAKATFPRPERLYQLVIVGTAADFPPVRSLDRTATFLPAQPSSFIGRELEIAEGQRLLEKARLVTLTGPGGTGKTRLSLRIAEESAAAFGDGTFFVPLAPITDPELVPSTIAHTLGVQVSGSELPLPRLIDHLKDKRMLLVLDNFEQILPAAPVVGQL